jgi:hypothetical protein
VGAASAETRWVTRATQKRRRHFPKRVVTMPRTTDAKRRVGARVNAKAHFVMSASDAERTCGSAWNSRLVSETVESVHEDDSVKRVSVFVTVMWDLPAGRKLRAASRLGRPPEPLEQRRTSLRRPPALLGTPTMIRTAVAVTGLLLLTVGQAHRHRPTGPTISSTRPRRRRMECFGKRRTCCSPWAGTYRRLWTLQTAAGDTIFVRRDAGSAISPRRPCFYSMAVFSPGQLVRMVELTNNKQATNKQPQLTTGGLLKFFGVLTLGTRHEFGHRAELWKTEAGNRHLQAPAFGTKTGMSRKRLMTFGCR